MVKEFKVGNDLIHLSQWTGEDLFFFFVDLIGLMSF